MISLYSYLKDTLGMMGLLAKLCLDGTFFLKTGRVTYFCLMLRVYSTYSCRDYESYLPNSAHSYMLIL